MIEKFPKKFLERQQSILGNEFESFIESLSQAAPTSIRINSNKKINSIFENLEKIEWCKEGFYLKERPVFTADPHFHAGAYYVQEASSMFLSFAFDYFYNEKKSLRILDLCAAPGGKSTLILDKIDDASLLISNEVIKPRAQILAENITKWGKLNVMVSNSDPKNFSSIDEYFDIIIIDAPCSGEGLFRKDKKAIDEWNEENLKTCTLRQRRIVQDILPSLKIGGYIFYSTCTFNPTENDENIDFFIQNMPLNVKKIDSDSTWFEQILKTKNGLQFYPHRTKGEGFYFSCLQKTDEVDNEKSKMKVKFYDNKVLKPEIQILNKYISGTDTMQFWKHNDIVYGTPKAFEQDIKYLESHIFFIKKGIELGKIIQNELIPAHDLALCSDLETNFPSLELTLNQAQVYLEKNDLSQLLQEQDIANGWNMVKYKNSSLGWIKKIENRFNNYLPKNLRVLKDWKEEN